MEHKNIIRRDAAGDVDDVVITGDMFRMERMNNNCFWVCIYRGGQRAAFFLNATDKGMEVTISDDAFNCHED